MNLAIALILFAAIAVGGLLATEAWTDYLDHKERMARLNKETGHGDDV